MLVFSYGGGVQSTAALVLAAEDQLAISTFLFANVGDDSEHPATLRYVHEVAIPYAAQHGIDLIELHRVRRTGERETLYERLTKPGSRSIPIPIHLSNGAPGRRACTADFKIKVIAKWLREHGATRDQPAQVAIGISRDEWWRGKDSQIPYLVNVYPFLDRRLGRWLTRADCVAIIEHAGLPVLDPSSCWFCPLHRQARWREMATQTPAVFGRAVDLERLVNARRSALGKDRVWFSNALVPLDQAVEARHTLRGVPVEMACESGYCGM